MAVRTTRRKLKTRSGRRIAAELLSTTRCHECKRPAIITKPEQTKNGTKWFSYCWVCAGFEEED